jgi:iron complex outermembrane receptor protein
MRWALGAVLLTTTGLATAVLAVPSPAAAQAARSYNIPASALADAINSYAEQSGAQILYDAALTQGRSSAGLQGQFGVAEGLSRLLAGSGVTFRQTGANIFTLEPAPQSADGAIQLGPVRVEGASGSGGAGYGIDSDPRITAARSSSSVALFAEKPLIEIPFSVGVYDQALIEDQRAFTLKEVLQNDPSVSVYDIGGYYGSQNFAVRGFQVDNFNGYRLDGLPFINTVASSIDDKSRVEVLKGPAALRFGFMAPGGAINIVRKRTEPEFKAGLQFDADTFGALYSQLDVSDTVAAGRFGYRLVLAGNRYDDFYDHAEGDRLMGSLATEWKLSGAAIAWTSIGYQKREFSAYYGPAISANGLILDTGIKTNMMQDWSRNRHETFDVGVGADINLNENWKMRGSLSYQETERDTRLSYPYAVQDNGDYIEGAQIGPAEFTTKGAHLHLEGKFATGRLKHDVVVGIQYYGYDSFERRVYPDVGPNNAYQLNPLPIPVVSPVGDRSPQFKYDETGLFATDTIALTKQFSVLLGIRNSRYKNVYKNDPASNDSVSTWLPSAALMYSPVDSVHTYVTYARGVQDGGFDADTWEPLGVQKSEQWEAGLKAEWLGGRMSGEAAVFQIEQDLRIVVPQATDRFSGLRRHRGLELALRGRVTDHLQAGVSTMFLDAEQTDTGDPALDGKRPIYAPKYQFNLWGDLAVPQVPGLSLNARARIVSDQYIDQMEQFAIGSYWVLDLGARYRFKMKDNDWTLRLNVRNALDKHYYESGYFLSGYAGNLAYGTPLSANFSLALSF